MIKVMYMEINTELGLMQNIGEKKLKTNSPKKAHKEAKVYQDILSEVRGKQVHYMLSKNNVILVTI